MLWDEKLLRWERGRKILFAKVHIIPLGPCYCCCCTSKKKKKNICLSLLTPSASSSSSPSCQKGPTMENLKKKKIEEMGKHIKNRRMVLLGRLFFLFFCHSFGQDGKMLRFYTFVFFFGSNLMVMSSASFQAEGCEVIATRARQSASWRLDRAFNFLEPTSKSLLLAVCSARGLIFWYQPVAAAVAAKWKTFQLQMQLHLKLCDLWESVKDEKGNW